MNREPKALHVVVGAGQIGPELAERLVRRGHRVRLVRRSAVGEAVSGVEWARGDVTDRAFVDRAFAGAAAVYHTANPSRYDRWDEELPPLSRAIRDAAARAGSRLVVLDNVYMYGIPRNGALSEDTPFEPVSKKGEIRARLAEELFEAHRRGDVRVTSGRAGDFFGPHAGRNSTMFGHTFLERLDKNRSALVFGNPDQPHAYAFTNDVAEGLAVLGENDRAFGRAWHLPTAWNASTRELIERFAAAADRSPRLSRVPTWTIRVAGLFSGEIRAFAEMIYQWETAFTVDDTAFRTAFGVDATPIDVAIAETLEAFTSSRNSTALGAKPNFSES